MDDLNNRVARQRRSGEQGFTLIELLVVITVLAILGAIVIFNVTGVANKGRAAACSTDIATVQVAVNQAINDNGGEALPPSFPSTNGDMKTTGDLKWLVDQKYLNTAPASCSPFTITESQVTRGTGGSAATVTAETVSGTPAPA
jgi:prepilin-type N-terminal cleavage/methylation domain-containing protein